MESRTIKITKGLDLPISGEPSQVISQVKHPVKVAVLGIDYISMKPQLEVSVGDYVQLGQVLFTDKKMPAVKYTSPGSGKVTEINRGDKRKLLSVVITLDDNDEVRFNSYPEQELQSLHRQDVSGLLLTSGLWTAIRSRPFSKVADPRTIPHSLFINAMDTNPLAPSMEKILESKERDFINGINVLSRLTDGNVYLCKDPEDNIPHPELEQLSVVEFAGPHPAGNSGTHIHFLDPVGHNRHVWYVNAQDVIAAGILFTTGRLNVERVVSIAGPSVMNPRLIRTRIGACLDDLTAGELRPGEHRTISGPVFSGHRANGPTDYLGRYHQQISIIPEGRTKEFLGWLNPGMNLFSIMNIVLSRFLPKKKFDFTTSTHGDKRSIVPVGAYEKVMPLDIIATHLLKALAVDDIEEAEKLGCLELDEEDLALCTFVCPSKIDHGAELHRNLILIEKEM
jgi:Na+-transporting NADH:ubiquinone oxidoreductase subunit A